MRNIGAFTVDTSFVVRAWDQWIARVTGIPAEAAHGQPLDKLVPGVETHGLLPMIAEVMREGSVRVLSAALHRYLIPCSPTAPSRYFAHMQQHVTIGPLREGERVLGAIVTIEDVTERREREIDQATASDEARTDTAGVRTVLREDDWQARRTATRALVEGGGDGSALISSLVSALREEHHNFAVVSSALQLLAQIQLDVVEPLVQLLDSRDADLRIQAALSLGEHRDTRAVPALLHALGDADANVRFHAIEALGKLRATEASAALVTIALSGDFFLAFAALDALGKIGDPRTAPQLVPLLQDDLLRAAAVDALGKLGDENTIAPLVALLEGTAAPVEAIAQAVVSLYRQSIQKYGEGQVIVDLVRRRTTPAAVERLIEAVNPAHGEGLRSLAIVLGWLDGENVPPTLARLLGHSNARREVVEGLVRFGPRVTDLLVKQLASDDTETRQAAVIALGRIGDRRATSALLDLMEHDRDLVLTAAGAIAKTGDPAAFDRLLPFLADPELAVRHAVIAALNSIGHAQMASHVVPMMNAADPRARESAVKIAGYFGYPEAIDILFERCHDENEDVRRAALEHLAFIDDERSVPTLIAALGADTPRARAAAAQALGRVETGAAVTSLVAALADPDAWVRYFAARSLGHHRKDETVLPLALVAQGDVATQVRLSAIDAVGRIGGPEAAAVLTPLCNDADAELAAAAIRALGNIGDNAAWPALRDSLRSNDPRRQMEAIRAVAQRDRGEATPLLEWAAAASGDPTIVREAAEALGRIAIASSASREDEGAIEALIRLTSDPPRREAAVAVLGALPAEKGAIVASGLSDARPEVRIAVVEALGRMRDERATALLRRALDDDASEVRRAAVAALSHLGSRGSESRLAALARNDPDQSVRIAASTALHSGQPESGNQGAGNRE